MNKYTPVSIPRSQPNDHYAIITKIHFKNGDKVSEGQLIAEIETTKSQIEIVAPTTGFLQLLCEEGAQVLVGSELGRISLEPVSETESTTSSPRMTRKALKNLRQQSSASDPNQYLSWVALKFSFSQLNEAISKSSGESWTPSAGDFIAFHALKLLPQFPGLCKDQVIHMGLVLWEENSGANLVTMRDSQKLNLKEFCARSQELLAELLRGQLSLNELTGASFTVTNMISSGVHSLMPRIPIGQSAILGIASPDENGEFQVVLSFDHRQADGILATKFLNALRTRIHSEKII